MLVWGNTGFAVWFNLIIGGIGAIMGISALSEGKDATALLIGSGFFLLLGLACLASKRDREAKAAQAVQQIYQQAVVDVSSAMQRKAALTCQDCNHENQPDWSFCSSCGSKKSV